MLDRLIAAAGAAHVREEEPMGRHTTFRCGGNARYFVTVTSEEMLTELIRLCRQEKLEYYLIGNGSNLLVKDEGYPGVMIKLEGEFRQISALDGSGLLRCGSGVLLANAAMAAAGGGLTGLEFAHGIPGSIGGAILMNAGAYGGEMKQIVRRVRVLKEDLTVQDYSGEEMQFGYRTSRLKHEKGIVLWAELELAKGEEAQIRKAMDELARQRREKQPLEFPSAGSTFKRPEGYFAGKLIQDAGLKGYRIGDAMVSEKHAGFVINAGHATATDVLTLMEDVIRLVRESSGVTLEPEVIIL